MTSKKQKPNLRDFGFACRIKRSGDTIELVCDVSRYEQGRGADTPRGVGSCNSGSGGEYDGLEISAFLYSDRREVGMTRLQFNSILGIDANRAAEMTRVFGKIERGLARLRKQFGYERHITEYIARVSIALGFGRAWLYRELQDWSGWQSYANPGEVVDALRYTIEAEFDRHNKVEEARAA